MTASKSKAERPPTFDHLRSMKKPRTERVRIYMDDELVDEFNAATNALDRVKLKRDPDADEVEGLQKEVDRLRKEMLEQSVELVFTSIGRKAYDELMRKHPPTQEQCEEWKKEVSPKGRPPYDLEKFPVALIAASLKEPVMTEDQVGELFEEWNAGEVDMLLRAALNVNTQRRVAELGNGPGPT